MSDTDSFIDEVNEEVRRDQLYHYLRRYGWIAVLAILLIVGGAAFSEYRKAQATAQAQDLGDAIIATLELDDASERAAALAGVSPSTPASAAVVRMLTAAEQVDAGQIDAAAATLDALSIDGEVPEIYRQIAQFKSLMLQSGVTPVAERRQSLDAMAAPGNPLRLLASEQLALIDVETGDLDAAIARYQTILTDAEVTSDLQQRALQVIVALGGEPELGDTAVQAQDAAETDN